MRDKSKGRILRIKRGYNPNSSSVGSDIPLFLFSSTALVVLSGIAAQVHSIITSHFQKKGKNDAATEQTTDAR